MTRSVRSNVLWLSCAVAVVAVSLTYFRGLADTPLYLGGDEAYFAVNAYTIATTGRDLNGHSWPLFFNIADPLMPNGQSPIWYQPTLVYLTAVVLKFLPFTEWAVRVPTVLVGLLNAVLIYFLVRRLLQDRFYAALASLLLLTSPPHFILTRQAVDYICPLPFVLGWLLCLATFVDTRRVRWLIAGGLLLGFGVYSYLASWMMMPFYLVLTCFTLRKSRNTNVLSLAATSLGFCVPLLLLVPWSASHPGMLQGLLSRYSVGSQGAFNGWHTSNILERVSVYWSYFNPSYLFFGGGINPTQSTRTSGVFLLPMSVFIACGLRDLWQRRSPISELLVFGFVCAPLAVVVTLPESPRYAIARELSVVPFGALIAVFGIAWLLRDPRRPVRVGTMLLLLAVPLQFGFFLKDYFTIYRVDSSSRFDPTNFRDVATFVIESDFRSRVPAVYLSEHLDDSGIRWTFYLLKNHREDLWTRTHRLPAQGLDDNQAPSGSVAVFYPSDPTLADLLHVGRWTTAQVIFNASGSESAVVLRNSGQ